MSTIVLESTKNNLNTVLGSYIGVCRTCLKIETEKDISDLPNDLCEDDKTDSDIIMFCLNLQITLESKVTTKLCFQCYSNIISYYKFKSLALKSDKYLRSLDENKDCKNEGFLTNIKSEKPDNNSDDYQSYIDMETCFVKEENIEEDLHSDDELLSEIQRMKHEDVDEKPKNNDLKPVKSRKLGKKQKKQVNVCEECGKKVSNLKDHMYLHLPKLDRKRFKCKLCDKTFASTSSKYKHYKTKHLGIKPHCDECNKEVVNLKAHKMLMHDTASLPFECVACGRRFLSRTQRDHHILSHTKGKPHHCLQCEKTFRTNDAMMQHKRKIHDNEKSHLCQICSKSFFKKYHLQQHLRSHTKEKPFKCPDCGKFFSSTSVLANHRLIHSEVKRFACQVCNMKFTKPGYVKVHSVIHTKEKKYECKYCGSRFRRSDHCLRHQRTTHEKIAKITE